MWLRKGSYVTSDSEIQYHSPPRRKGKGGVYTPEPGSGGWGSTGTASVVEGLSIPEAREPESREPGGQWAIGTVVEEGGRRQVGVTWRIQRISWVK